MLAWQSGQFGISVDCREEGPGYCRGSVTITRQGNIIRSENHLSPMPHGGCTQAEKELLRRTLAWFQVGGEM